MRVKAEIKPLEGPLPGGQAGASVVVEPLKVGEVRFPRAYFERSAERLPLLRAIFTPLSKWEYVPCPAFVIRHPGAGVVVVDTGLHQSVATEPKQNMGRAWAKFAGPRLGPEESLPAQLRAKGIDLSQVRTVIMTHLHQDHVSGLSEFADSTIVLSTTEWESATKGMVALRGYRPAQYDYVFDYRGVDFGGPTGIDSYGGFARTFDLFGDGSVKLAYTPGHTAGHMSVIAHLGRRDFLIAADAIYTWRQLEGGPLPAQIIDEHDWKRSLRELQSFHQQQPHAVIVPGHDAAFFAKLDPRYEE